MKIFVLFLVSLGACVDAKADSLPNGDSSEPGISFSFDDGFDPRKQSQAAEWNASILRALADARLRVTYFPAGNVVDSKEGLQLVEAWNDAGHWIGNHTYKHQNLNSERITASSFVEDIEYNESLLGHFSNWSKRLRFPYLKVGATAQERDYVRKWLKSHGYQSGAVSIDASDWYYDVRFKQWKGQNPKEDSSAFRDAYISHLWERAEYYENLSQQTVGGRSSHVMLLHTNAINAEFLPHVIEMFREKGWRFVSSEEAFNSPLFQLEPSVVPAGESILWALAKQVGIANLRYPAEDAKYEKPILDSLGL
jgi:peptidoglycan/xylan/chitin deacetylase (PgdA/CDA1 family)